jgi:hypothetical protein
MVRQAKEILDTLSEHREAIRAYGVRRLGLFDSHVRDAAGAASDLDFVVDFETKSFDGYMDLKFFLEELFSSKVDLVLESTIKPRLRDVILGEALYAPGL